jgi:excinuclease ABC subunit A
VTTRRIELRGAAVHNLKQINLDLPHGKLIVLCGPSGSGKSSLALDTLYAEGQRRYIECFSPQARQFLGQIERPAAARIDGVPPAVAVRHDVSVRSSRATVGTATEIVEYLRLLLASIGHVICPSCGRLIVRDQPQSVVEQLSQLPQGTRIVVAFTPNSDIEQAEEQPLLPKPNGLSAQSIAQLKKAGFVRVLVGGQMRTLDEFAADVSPSHRADVFVVVDRLVIGGPEQRLRESIETAFAQGLGTCDVSIESAKGFASHNHDSATSESSAPSAVSLEHRRFCEALRCPVCRIDFPEPDPKRLSFDSPLGACPACEGFGNVMDLDMELIVPDPAKSIRDGAVAPWNTKSYAHELEELLATTR